MNTAVFAGYIGGDVKLETTNNGKAVASFTLAVRDGRDPNRHEKPLWVKAVAWQKRAEALAPYLTKGRMVAVSGPISLEVWTDNQREPRAMIVLQIRELTFCGGSSEHVRDSKPEGAA